MTVTPEVLSALSSGGGVWGLRGCMFKRGAHIYHSLVPRLSNNNREPGYEANIYHCDFTIRSIHPNLSGRQLNVSCCCPKTFDSLEKAVLEEYKRIGTWLSFSPEDWIVAYKETGYYLG